MKKTEMPEVDETLVADFQKVKAELEAQIQTLTAERDEARQLLKEAIAPPSDATHKLGDIIERDGQKLRRVKVVSGRGNFAYWHRNLPKGEEAGWLVVVDMVDNIMASHRAGKLYETHEGRPGAENWVVMNS